MAPHILATLILIIGYATTFSFAEGTTMEIALLGGTILSIDQEVLTIAIRMPSGESQALTIMDRRLLQGLGLGDHVSFELDGAHRLIKIIKLPIDPAN